jgi:hypothetical protein
MSKRFVAVVVLTVIAVAGCADERRSPAVQPTSHQSVPLPPVKPERLRSAAMQQSAFTISLQIAGYL